MAGGWKVVRVREEVHARIAVAAGGRSVASWVEDAVEAALRGPALADPAVRAVSSAAPLSVVTAVARSARRRRCSEHPEAGAVQVNGRWFCKEPGCPNLLNP
jgi:hypothetical protein